MTLNSELHLLLNGVCPVPSLGVIQVQGEDAAQFLHNQLTNDVLLLPVGQARLAAWCNAKGRMQVSLIVLKMAPDTVLLVLPTELLPQTLKRLSLFVLRAKVKLSDVSTQWQLRGLMGSVASMQTTDVPPWEVSPCGDARVVALYPARWEKMAVPRGLWIAGLGVAPPAINASAQLWTWAEVLSAVPLITAPLFEVFVPQMLNYESVGGVNFQKGCYPGQEVVARSQFRGSLKRRMTRVSSPSPLQAGQEVFTSADPEQACGMVVLAAERPNGDTWDALVSTTLDSMSQGLHLGHADGPVLALKELPYRLRTDL